MPDDPDNDDAQLPSDIGPADGPSLFDMTSKAIQDAVGDGADAGPPVLDPETDPNWTPSEGELKDMEENSSGLPGPDNYPSTNDGDPLPDKEDFSPDDGGQESGDEGNSDDGSGGDGAGGGESGTDGDDGGGGGG